MGATGQGLLTDGRSLRQGSFSTSCASSPSLIANTTTVSASRTRFDRTKGQPAIFIPRGLQRAFALTPDARLVLLVPTGSSPLTQTHLITVLDTTFPSLS